MFYLIDKIFLIQCYCCPIRLLFSANYHSTQIDLTHLNQILIELEMAHKANKKIIIYNNVIKFTF